MDGNQLEKCVSEQELSRHHLDALLKEAKEIVAQNDLYYAVVLHDLKNLILPLLAYSELLTMEGISYEKMRTIAEKMNRSAGEVIDAFTNVLETNKKKTKFFSPVPSEWNLHNKVEELYSILSPLFEKKRLKFENLLEKTQKVYADSGMIYSVLLNLLTNAIKFTPQGEKIVVFGAKIGENLFQVNVKDNGMGIDEKKRDELFSPYCFFTTKGTEEELGTGLGLAHCKDLVQRNHGNIYAENNQDGNGATFSFTLPICEVK